MKKHLLKKFNARAYIHSLYGDTYDISLSKVDRVVSQEVRRATGNGIYNPVNVCREVKSIVHEAYDEISD